MNAPQTTSPRPLALAAAALLLSAASPGAADVGLGGTRDIAVNARLGVEVDPGQAKILARQTAEQESQDFAEEAIADLRQQVRDATRLAATTASEEIPSPPAPDLPPPSEVERPSLDWTAGTARSKAEAWVEDEAARTGSFQLPHPDGEGLLDLELVATEPEVGSMGPAEAIRFLQSRDLALDLRLVAARADHSLNEVASVRGHFLTTEGGDPVLVDLWLNVRLDGALVPLQAVVVSVDGERVLAALGGRALQHTFD